MRAVSLSYPGWAVSAQGCLNWWLLISDTTGKIKDLMLFVIVSNVTIMIHLLLCRLQDPEPLDICIVCHNCVKRVDIIIALAKFQFVEEFVLVGCNVHVDYRV